MLKRQAGVDMARGMRSWAGVAMAFSLIGQIALAGEQEAELRAAAAVGDVETLRELLDRGADVDAPNR